MKEGDPETSLMKKKRGAASLKKIVIPEKVVVSRYLSEEKLHQQMRWDLEQEQRHELRNNFWTSRVTGLARESEISNRITQGTERINWN